MRAKLQREEPERAWLLVLGPGDETIETLRRFAEERSVSGAWFTGLGAFRECVVAWYDLEAKAYRENPFDEQLEVASIVGDIGVREDGEVLVHAHVSLGRSDGTALGGHLVSGVVRPTLEVRLVELAWGLTRRHDEESGLPLIDLQAAEIP
ncbi:MAG: PPC domain-containing DNA-binding protein [Gemmatimonadota bacterium]|nr:PPC domain-containing DNA-binding protein [Gemmatimonadota bacterium]